MDFDLSEEQANKFNRALAGESVDLSDGEAEQFNQMLQHRKAAAPAAPAGGQPSLLSQGWDALKAAPGQVLDRMQGQSVDTLSAIMGRPTAPDEQGLLHKALALANPVTMGPVVAEGGARLANTLAEHLGLPIPVVMRYLAARGYQTTDLAAGGSVGENRGINPDDPNTLAAVNKLEGTLGAGGTAALTAGAQVPGMLAQTLAPGKLLSGLAPKAGPALQAFLATLGNAGGNAGISAMGEPAGERANAAAGPYLATGEALAHGQLPSFEAAAPLLLAGLGGMADAVHPNAEAARFAVEQQKRAINAVPHQPAEVMRYMGADPATKVGGQPFPSPEPGTVPGMVEGFNPDGSPQMHDPMAALANIEQLAGEAGTVPGEHMGFDMQGRPIVETASINERSRANRATEVVRAPKVTDPLDGAIGWLMGNDEKPVGEGTRSERAPSARDNQKTGVLDAPALADTVMSQPKTQAEAVRPEAQLIAAPPIGPRPPPVEVPLENLAVFAHNAQQMARKETAPVRNFLKGLGLDENRASPEVANALRQMKFAKASKDIVLERSFPKLRAAVKSLPREQQANVRRIMTELRDGKGTAEHVKALPEEFQKLFSQLERENDAHRLSLAKAGYLSLEMVNTMVKKARAGVPWLHQSYEAHMSGKWKGPTVDGYSDAVRYLVGKGMNAADAHLEVRALIRESLPGTGPARSPEMRFADSKLSRDILKSRKLPAEMRGLYGLISDPAFLAAHSHAELAGLYHQFKVTQAIGAPGNEGTLWAKQWGPNMYERPLFDSTKSSFENKQMYGELAGKFVTPELYEAMQQQPTHAATSQIVSLLQTSTNWFRVAKVLMSPATFLRNALGNSMYLQFAGVPTRRWPALMKSALQAMSDYDKHLTKPKEGKPGHWLEMAMEDMAVRAGRGSEFGGGEARAIVENLIRAAPEGMAGVYDKLFRHVDQGKMKLGKAYEAMDTVNRLMAYMHHVQLGRSMGLSAAESRARASSIVNRYFATGASVGPSVKAATKYSLGLAPFLSWHADNIRVHKNVLADAVKGRVGPAVRGMLWAGAPMAGMYLARQLSGISDDEVSTGERSLKGSWRKNNPFYDWLPVRTKDGSMYAVSLDAINPSATFFKGANLGNDPAQTAGRLPAAIAANVMKGFTDSGWLEPWADQRLAELGLGEADYAPSTLPGNEGYDALARAYDYMQPGLLRQYTDIMRKAQQSGQLRPGEEPMGLGEAAVLKGPLNPFPTEKVGPRTAEARRRSEQGEVKELQSAKKRALRQPAGAEQARVLGEAERRLEDLRRHQEKR